MQQIEITNFKLELCYPLGMHNDKITVTSSVIKPYIVTQLSVQCWKKLCLSSIPCSIYTKGPVLRAIHHSLCLHQRNGKQENCAFLSDWYKCVSFISVTRICSSTRKHEQPITIQRDKSGIKTVWFDGKISKCRDNLTLWQQCFTKRRVHMRGLVP